MDDPGEIAGKTSKRERVDVIKGASSVNEQEAMDALVIDESNHIREKKRWDHRIRIGLRVLLLILGGITIVVLWSLVIACVGLWVWHSFIGPDCWLWITAEKIMDFERRLSGALIAWILVQGGHFFKPLIDKYIRE